MRGIVALGVIYIHAGLVVNGQETAAASGVRIFLNSLCVPFFLAAALYFAAASFLNGDPHAPLWPGLKKSGRRLLVPYAFWTVVYTAALAAKLFVTHQGSGVREIAADPLGRIFFGGSAVMLYFLPLLFTGLVVGRLAAPVLRKLSPVWLGLLFAVALAVAQAVALSGNAYRLDNGRAFEPALATLAGPARAAVWAGFAPARFALVFLAFAIRCFPYTALAFLALRLPPAAASGPWIGLLVTSGALAAIAAAASVPAVPIPASLLGFSLFFLSFILSRALPSGLAACTAQIGAFSFAVFLIHQIFLEALQMGLRGRVHSPVGVAGIGAISFLTFALSYLLTFLVSLGRLSRLRAAFGLPSIK